jgi:hypothetical protein
MRLALTIEAKEHPDKPPAIVRLRRCLKGMLRGYGVRVVEIRPVR